jgi:2-polyprenyl-3-methyl-5-hydroxy-6-metoxy-1,4-benzoquinol methylase
MAMRDFPELDSRPSHWKEEATFFDKRASRAGNSLQPVDPLAVKRYGSPLRKRLAAEYRFYILGNLAGKAVLEVGCGDGANAILLAKLGAQVVGVDLSPASIELAKKRAALNGVCDSVQFVCSPLELVNLPANYFDAIVGVGVLHHVIASLDLVLRRLVTSAKSCGMFMFAEPINFNSTLRRIRLSVPVHTEVTPHERPLEKAEIEVIKYAIPDLAVRPFALFGRMDRFVLSDENYERSSAPRRLISNVLAATDWLLLSLPGVRDLGGTAVLYGHPDKSKGWLPTGTVASSSDTPGRLTVVPGQSEGSDPCLTSNR